MKTCWLVTSSLARTCRSCFEMESLEMKRIVEISWSQWRLGHNINASGRRYGRYLTYPHGLLFGLVLRWWKSARRADERRGIWNTSDGKFSDCSLERCELGYGLRLSTFCIGCHWNTLLLPDVSRTEAFDRFLRLMICTFFHSEQIHWFAGCYWTNCGPSFPSTVLSITDCLGLTKLSQSLQSQACCRSSISLLLVTL